MTTPIRVAAAQFAIGTDVAANLATCLRMIDQAAAYKPHLIVLPEFCNHASWYQDNAHCYDVSVSLDGDFVAAIGRKAAEHACYIMLNCTVRRPEARVTDTNILLDPFGAIIATSDKQVLMGNENNFITTATQTGPIIELPIGRVGMYSCMDGVIFETPRGLALRGAQILCNSLNSFADDEASLHVPVRAAENKVFVVAANKVGPLVPEDLLETIARRIQISPEQLHGAGESQIVAPNGDILAKAPRTGEAVIYADIIPTRADDKQRPDGTDIFSARRPQLYRPLAQKPTERRYRQGASSVPVAIYQPLADGMDAIEEVASLIAEKSGWRLLVLPELFHLEAGRVSDPERAVIASQQMVSMLQNALGDGCYVATSVVQRVGDGYAHTGILFNADGICFSQTQLHRVQRHAAWQTALGDALHTYDLPFARLALIVGEDSIYPEVFRLAALQNAEIALVTGHIGEAWETRSGLLERAAENRMGIAFSTRATPSGRGLIITIDEDFTLWTEWKNRPFDGNINYPIVTRLADDQNLLIADLHPARSANRLVSQKTDVVDSRPWWLLEALTTS